MPQHLIGVARQNAAKKVPPLLLRGLDGDSVKLTQDRRMTQAILQNSLTVLDRLDIAFETLKNRLSGDFENAIVAARHRVEQRVQP